MRKALGVVFSGVVLFVWGYVSWVVLPWHDQVANRFTSEEAVAAVLKENAPQAGIYYLPFSQLDQGFGETAAFVNVLPDGHAAGMVQMMAVAVVGQWVGALLVALLLGHTFALGYVRRVRFVALTGLVVGFVSHFPYWNWFGFSTQYFIVIILDSLIAWLLAGLVMAMFITGRRV